MERPKFQKRAGPSRAQAKEDERGVGEKRITVEELASYIADVSAELATLARRANLSVLAGLLELANVEAKHRGVPGGSTLPPGN